MSKKRRQGDNMSRDTVQHKMSLLMAEKVHLRCGGLAGHELHRDLGVLEVLGGAPTMQHLGDPGVCQEVIA